MHEIFATRRTTNKSIDGLYCGQHIISMAYQIIEQLKGENNLFEESIYMIKSLDFIQNILLFYWKSLSNGFDVKLRI